MVYLEFGGYIFIHCAIGIPFFRLGKHLILI